MRDGGELFYLLGDHLGSTSLTLDANGNKVAEQLVPFVSGCKVSNKGEKTSVPPSFTPLEAFEVTVLSGDTQLSTQINSIIATPAQFKPNLSPVLLPSSTPIPTLTLSHSEFFQNWSIAMPTFHTVIPIPGQVK
jgi:hypothetical protein